MEEEAGPEAERADLEIGRAGRKIWVEACLLVLSAQGCLMSQVPFSDVYQLNTELISLVYDFSR